MMYELNNPDWTKTDEELEALKLKDPTWKLWFKATHQYPHQNRMIPTRRIWLNPFYFRNIAEFWINCVENIAEASK